jgi:hypothetical protein
MPAGYSASSHGARRFAPQVAVHPSVGLVVVVQSPKCGMLPEPLTKRGAIERLARVTWS